MIQKREEKKWNFSIKRQLKFFTAKLNFKKL